MVSAGLPSPPDFPRFYFQPLATYFRAKKLCPRSGEEVGNPNRKRVVDEVKKFLCQEIRSQRPQDGKGVHRAAGLFSKLVRAWRHQAPRSTHRRQRLAALRILPPAAQDHREHFV